MIKIKLKETTSHPLLDIIKLLPSPEATGPIIAGGSVRNMIQNQPIESDVDIYFNSIEQLVRFQYVLKHANFMTPSPFSYNYMIGNTKMQLMHFKFFPDIESLFKDFDFTVCQFAYHNGYVYATEEALQHEKERKLVFTPDCVDNRTFYRIHKYKKKGYYCPAETFDQARIATESRPKNRVKYIDRELTDEERQIILDIKKEFKIKYGEFPIITTDLIERYKSGNKNLLYRDIES